MYVQTYNTVMLLAWCLVSIGAGMVGGFLMIRYWRRQPPFSARRR